MFLLYFVPFKKDDQKRKVTIVLQAMVFNYLLITQSNLVIDPETKNIFSWLMVTHVCGIIVFEFLSAVVGGIISAINTCK